MRINTEGNKEWRSDLYERTADTLEQNTKTGAIDSACIHANQDPDAKREALQFLSGELPPQQLEQVAQISTTDEIELSAGTNTDIST